MHNEIVRPVVCATLAFTVLTAAGCKDGAARQADGGFARPEEATGPSEITIDMNDPESLYIAGQQEFIAGEFARAAEHLRIAIKLKPSARAWHALGDALIAQALFSDAAAAFQQAIALEPNKRFSWMRLGRCFINTSRFSQAAEAYEKARALDPKDPVAYREGAEALLEAKRDADAAALLLQASALPVPPAERAMDLKLVGQIWSRAGEHEKALAPLRQSVELVADAEALMLLGVALVQKGELDAGAKALEQAARADEKNPVPWELVGEIRARRGDVQGARTAFESSLKALDRPQPHLALAQLSLAGGDRGAALKELDLALGAIQGENTQDIREVAAFAGRLNEWAIAEKLLSMLAEEEDAGKDPTVWLDLAWARQGLGNPEKVTEACTRAGALVGADAGLSCPPPKPSVEP